MPHNFLCKSVAAAILLCGFAASPSLLASTPETARTSPRWLRLYQYERNFFGRIKSKVTSDQFFFSPAGQSDPLAELNAAAEAYRAPEKLFGTQKQPAACVFPARKKVLEDLLQIRFPEVPCPDLQAWVERINADQASLVFVGAYPGNPASILGHSFLRLSNSATEKTKRDGIDLLSYSIGFMAIPDRRDNRLIYMMKGLAGGYDGFYEIEPHFMKVGLYNNSESRDLWDLHLNLSPEEVRLLVLHYWELTFNSKIPYYFIDENCSYRLITLIEAVRPDLDISSHLSTVVLPAETVRAAIDAGLADRNARFRSSVKRRMNLKLSLLTAEARTSVDSARGSPEAVRNLTDPTALDALLDYWLYENYRLKTNLAPAQAEIMEATYARASELAVDSKFKAITDSEIRERFQLEAPYEGHRPRWFETQIGAAEAGPIGGFKYSSGVHPFWSGDPGYKDISAIEYLGGEVEFRESESARWRLFLIDAKSFNDFSGLDKRISWSFEANLKNHCLLCQTERTQVHVGGGAGLASSGRSMTGYLLVHAEAAAWEDSGAQGLFAPGIKAGFKFEWRDSTYVAEAAKHWWKANDELQIDSRWNYALSKNQNLFIRLRYEELRSVRDDLSSTVGWAHFF